MRTRTLHFVLVLVLTSSANSAFAQLSFPKFDVELKGGFCHIDADKSINDAYQTENPYTINIQGAIHWQLNQNIGIGWTYTRSVTGQIKYTQNDGDEKMKQNLSMMMNGPEIRFSTGRIKNWRPYLSISYQMVEIVEDRSGTRFAHKTNAIGGGIGIMRKLGSKLYWNVLEVNAHQLSEQIYWLTESNLILQAKMGVTYNFGKQK